MTSYYAQHRQLSRETYQNYNLYGRSPRNIDDRLHFYLTYLPDVVPHGVTVHHYPTRSPYTHSMTSAPVQREEIRLLAENGRVFMTGLVSLENVANGIENRAAGEAYTKMRNGYFVDETWRFFSGLTDVRFCNGYESNGADWERVGAFDPMRDAREIAAYLQGEYDQLGRSA